MDIYGNLYEEIFQKIKENDKMYFTDVKFIIKKDKGIVTILPIE